MQALIILRYLKLGSGNSDCLFSAFMNVQENLVVDSFKTLVLPKYFGVYVKSRDFFLQEPASIAGLLNDTDKLVSICDGTNLRHEKRAIIFTKRGPALFRKNICVKFLRYAQQIDVLL